MAAKEIHIGIVSRTNDPQQIGRIRVKCRTLARADVELPYWVRPIVPFSGKGHGWFHVPAPGDVVDLEVCTRDDSDETYGETFMLTPDMRYRAAEYDANLMPIGEEFKVNYPHRRGLKTKQGHLILFDDKPGKEAVIIKANFGSPAKPTTITLTKNKVLIDNVDADLEVKVKTCELIDGADQHMVRGEDLKAWLVGHTHGTPAGPSSTPVQPWIETILSQFAKLK
jgi:hypothetical protein